MFNKEQRLWHPNLEMGESTGTKRKETPRDEFEFEEDEVCKEDCDQSKHHKRIRSTHLHNRNERMRRHRLKQKIKTLQELIPNCNNRSKLSTFDLAINYIKALQHQLQVMSMGAGHATFEYPETMMPSPSPFPQTGTHPIGVKCGNGMEIEMETPGTLHFQTSHVGSPDLCFLPSSMDGLSAAAAHSVPSSFNFISPVQSNMRRESTTRVLPTTIVQPHHSKEE